MATEEDLKKAESADDESAEDAEDARPPEESSGDAKIRAEDAKAEGAGDEDPASKSAGEDGIDPSIQVPVQLGYQRYVYAVYMAGAMLVAFLAAKIVHTSWYRLGQWKPEFGEPVDDFIYLPAGLIGIATAVYYWRKPSSRQYTDEVAEELSKVTWPSRKEVTNSTTVVVLTTLFATVFFALMDRFWGFITDKIYTF